MIFDFPYRTDGLRATKEVVGTSKIDYIYDGQTVIGEIHKNPSGTVTKKVWMTPGPNGYINRTETDANDVVTNKEWFVYDGLGSCRAMVKPNAQGTDAIITARFDYDVYGKERVTQPPSNSANSFRYVGGSCGHPTDDETGLIYMRARYYDPGTGRFVAEDPGMDGMNWFSYAHNNPVNKVDLDGKVAALLVLLWTGAAAGIGAYFGFLMGWNDVASDSKQRGFSPFDFGGAWLVGGFANVTGATVLVQREMDKTPSDVSYCMTKGP